MGQGLGQILPDGQSHDRESLLILAEPFSRLREVWKYRSVSLLVAGAYASHCGLTRQDHHSDTRDNDSAETLDDKQPERGQIRRAFATPHYSPFPSTDARNTVHSRDDDPGKETSEGPGDQGRGVEECDPLGELEGLRALIRHGPDGVSTATNLVPARHEEHHTGEIARLEDAESDSDGHHASHGVNTDHGE